MSKSATLSIKIVGDATGAKTGFAEAETASEKFGRGLDKASLAAGGALVGIAALAKGAFDAASDLQQSTGAIDAVFGDWAIDIEQSAQTAADSVGLSTSAYENMASVIGAQLKNAGLSIADVTGQTQGLISTGADMAAIFGGTAADAVDALSSALKGEMDPIERYGVSLSQSAIATQLAADGNDKLTGAALKSAQTQAILELITKQTADTHGQWAAQAGTAAEAQQRLSSKVEDVKAKLGDALLPVVGEFIDKLSGMADWVGKNTDTVQKLVVGIAALAAGVLLVNGAVTTYRAIAAVAAAAQWAWNVAMSANPIALVVVAIGLVIAAIVLAYQHFGPFRDIVDAVGRALKTAFEAAKGAISWVVDKIEWVLGKIGAVGSFIGGLFGAGAPAPRGAAAPPTAGRYGSPAGLRAAAGLLAAGPGTGSGAPSGAAGLLTAPAGDTFNVTITGVLNADDAADQIARLLERRDRFTGRALAAAL